MAQRSTAGKHSMLYTLRRRARISQKRAGAYFGVSRDAVSDWEHDVTVPELDRRTRFISYLWDELGLKYHPEEFERTWHEVMVALWLWPPLTADERSARTSPSTPHADLIVSERRIPQTVPREILPPSHPFVGREREASKIAAYLDQALAAQHMAMCAIRGMGGVGKTELAREVAGRLRDRFPDGQLQVDLLGEEPAHQRSEQMVAPSSILRNIIEKLERSNAASATEAELGALYRSVLSGRRLLILADNARDRAQVEPLRPPAGCALIVTSRHHISVAGMRSFALDVLHPESHRRAAEVLLLEICPDIGDHAPELARLCGYLPLALRVCASLLHETSRDPKTLIADLQHERLAHMTSPDAPDDPTLSVAASLRLSYEALAPELQQAMQQLSVFPTHFDRDAAAVLECTNPVEHTLERLYLRSVIEYHRENDRYALHDLVREFCLRRLDDADAVRLRHAQHYMRVAKMAEQRYVAGEPLEGLALFDLERAHIDTGWEWAHQHAGDPAADELLIEYDGTLFYIGDLRYDHRTERIWQAEAMRDAALRLGQRRALMLSYNNLAIPYFRLGDYRAAIDAFEAGLALARELGDVMQEGNFLNNISFGMIRIGELDRAIEYAHARITVALQLPERRAVLRAEAAGMANLADAYLRRGDARQSLACAQRGYELTMEYGDRRGQCTALGNIASAYRDLGEHETAIEYFEQAICVADELKDREELAESSWKLGTLLVEREPARALSLMQVQIDHLEALQHPELARYQTEFLELSERIASRTLGSFKEAQLGT